MNQRNLKNENFENMKSGRIDAACLRYGLGRNTMRAVASDAGAVVRIGKIYLINYSIVDSYLDSLSGQ